MPRPLRIQYPGAVYHVTARGVRRTAIFDDDEDRERLLALMGQQFEAYEARAFAYCLMGNHFHFVLQTRHANLSDLMRRISGAYTSLFNRRHGLSGHVFDGRYNAIVVDAQRHLLEVCRYVELNPVRAGLALQAAAWSWSSHAANTGREEAPAWLATDVIHKMLLGRDISSVPDREEAQRWYARHVDNGRDVDLWRKTLRDRVFLGDEAFVARVQARLAAGQSGD